MKKALLILAAMAMGASAFAQGTITFFNRNLTGSDGNLYNAFVFRPGGTAAGIGAGEGFTAGLFLAGAADNAAPLLTAAGAPGTVTFRTTTLQGGFAGPVDVVVPGVAAGSTASLIFRAWATSAGSYGNAVATGALRGQSETPFQTLALGGPNPDPNLPGIPSPGMGPNARGFELVPEPSTIALGALGIGALLLRRRK